MNQKNLLIIAGGAVGAMVIYRVIQRKRQAKRAAEAAKAEAEKKQLPPAPKPAPGSMGPTDYQKKVMRLQSNVGAAIDGAPGPQTNRLVQEFFPITFQKLGNVSAANIDQYLALGTRRESAGPNRGTAVWNAMSASRPAVIRKDLTGPNHYYDESAKTYKPTGGQFTIPSGTRIYRSNVVGKSADYSFWIVRVPVRDGSIKQIGFYPSDDNIFVP